MGYSPERKAAVLKRMLPPNSLPLRHLSQEEGISEATLYKWRAQARGTGQLLPDADARRPAGRRAISLRRCCTSNVGFCRDDLCGSDCRSNPGADWHAPPPPFELDKPVGGEPAAKQRTCHRAHHRPTGRCHRHGA
jgi:hypothetical protein